MIHFIQKEASQMITYQQLCEQNDLYRTTYAIEAYKQLKFRKISAV